MIVKAFEIKINHVKENKIFLFYGNNQGHKNEIINNLFLNSFQGEIIKIHEDEIVEKTDILLENLMNLSLFENSKLLIVSRVTNKITDFISKFLDKDLKDVKILLNSENLEKSSKLRSFFEKQKKLIEIPICCETDFKLDHDRLEKLLKIKFDEILDIFFNKEYFCYMTGFIAGMPFLGDVNEKLRLKRLETPRVKVPKGSIGLTEQFCNIYTYESPGGWNIIGNTPLEIFNKNNQHEPALINPGDIVKFKQITKEEYDKIKS